MFEVFLKAKSVDKFDIYSHICEPRRGRALQNILNSHVSITLNYANSFLSHFKTVIIIEILYDTLWEILQIYDPTGVIQRNTIPIKVDSRANEWKRTPSVEATFGRSNKYISSNILVRSIAEYF